MTRAAALLAALLLFSAARVSAQPVENETMKRCLLTVLGDAAAPLPTPANPIDRKGADSLVNGTEIVGEKYVIRKEPSLNVGGAYDLYAAYDPQTHRLLAVQRTFSWTYFSLYAVPRLACALPEAPLGNVRTKAGFSLGSNERDVVARLGAGDLIRDNGLTGRYYKDECDSIKFVFRDGRIVEIDADPGAWC